MPSANKNYNQGSVVVTEEVPVETSTNSTTETTTIHNRTPANNNNDSTTTTTTTTTNPQNNDTPPPNSSSSSSLQLSLADLEICQRLDLEYERAREEGQVGWSARYESVRQAALVSVLVCLMYLVIGTAFFTHLAGWEIHEALFFSIYTMTTVGYGIALDIPKHPVFQLFCIVYIFTGVAILTILAAQVYQFVALEASRAQQERDVIIVGSRRRRRRRRKQRGPTDGIMKDDNHEEEEEDHRTSSNSSLPQRSSSQKSSRRSAFEIQHDDIVNLDSPPVHWWDKALVYYERFKLWLRISPMGKAVNKIFPFAGLILIGAIVVGPIEGWGPMESLYFACVSLTTVGYGVFVPKNTLSIYFCIVWLPFSVGFMSLFLANIATFYIRMSDKNVRRLERQMRRNIQRQKEAQQRRVHLQNGTARAEWHDSPESSRHVVMEASDKQDEEEPQQQSSLRRRSSNAAGAEGFARLDDHNPDDPLSLTNDRSVGELRRQQILDNHHRDASNGQTMQTMRDVLRTIGSSDVLSSPSTSTGLAASSSSASSTTTDASTTLTTPAITNKPTFALRILVQERLAEIIALDIAGYTSRTMEVASSNNKSIDASATSSSTSTIMSVSMESLKVVADKWCIPRKARKAFRQVCFSILLFVGEHSLITKGASALLDDLTLFEFHGLLAPLLAAMGDALDVWLEATQVLAEVELGATQQRPPTPPPSSSSSSSARIVEEEEDDDDDDENEII